MTQKFSPNKQIELNFEAGLHQQWPEFMDCVRASVHGCGRQFKQVAADLDLSSSALSRKLADNPDDNVHYQLRHFVALLKATGDMRPLYWLVEEFLEPVGSRQEQIDRQLAELLPRIAALVEARQSGAA